MKKNKAYAYQENWICIMGVIFIFILVWMGVIFSSEQREDGGQSLPSKLKI